MKISPLCERFLVNEEGFIFELTGSQPTINMVNGYMSVQYRSGGKQHIHLVHRLVASAYCTGYAPDMTVDHIDGNKLNNAARNLEWVSRSENSRRAYAAGVTSTRGERNSSSRLRNEDVISIRNLADDGAAMASIAEKFGVTVKHIREIVRRRRWAHI